MPDCGSQIILCDLPVRFDTYKGCSHGCKYCFVTRKYDISDIRPGEGVKALARFITGHRSSDTDWCDWNIPLHWGGMSDPFQPIELRHGLSLACLKLFAETQYPFVVSTKGTAVLTRPEYLDVLRKCNAAVQVSMASPQYDALEPGAPPFAERLAALPTLALTSRRLIVRVQPYVREIKRDVIDAIPHYHNAGVYGLTIEGLKHLSKRPGFVRCGGDFVYPVEVLKRDFSEIREACRAAGVHFFCAENRLRSMGESLCCCGVDGLAGFTTNQANLAHYVAEGRIEYTERMKNAGLKNQCFKSLAQTSVACSYFTGHSFASIMDALSRDAAAIAALRKR